MIRLLFTTVILIVMLLAQEAYSYDYPLGLPQDEAAASMSRANATLDHTVPRTWVDAADFTKEYAKGLDRVGNTAIAASAGIAAGAVGAEAALCALATEGACVVASSAGLATAVQIGGVGLTFKGAAKISDIASSVAGLEGNRERRAAAAGSDAAEKLKDSWAAAGLSVEHCRSTNDPECYYSLSDDARSSIEAADHANDQLTKIDPRGWDAADKEYFATAGIKIAFDLVVGELSDKTIEDYLGKKILHEVSTLLVDPLLGDPIKDKVKAFLDEQDKYSQEKANRKTAIGVPSPSAPRSSPAAGEQRRSQDFPSPPQRPALPSRGTRPIEGACLLLGTC